MVLGLLLMTGLTETVVRHSGQYLQCSRGDCLMLGDSEVDLMFDQPKYLLIYRLGSAYLHIVYVQISA